MSKNNYLEQIKVNVEVINKKYVLFIGGILYWYLFYLGGSPEITHQDWVKEQVYLNSLRVLLEGFVVPWEWKDSFYHGSKFFMANPEVILLPDLIFLKFFNNNQFIFLHHSILYGIGYFYLFKISSEIKLELKAFYLLFILFNFNGYITSHIAEGHFQWTGYYLMPALMYYLYKANLKEKINSNQISAGIVLGIMFANGSFHMAIWLTIYICLLTIFNIQTFRSTLIIFIVGYGIGCFRIVPALIYFPSISIKGFQSGFTDLSLLLDALTQLRGHGYGATTAVGWWEYNLYVGFSGLFLITVGLFLFFKRKLRESDINLNWLYASLIMFLLACGNTWSIFSALHIPLGGIERLSSRFIIIPLIIAICAAVYSLNIYLKENKDFKLNFLMIALLFFISVDLLYQFLNWSLITVQNTIGKNVQIPVMEFVEPISHNYKFIVLFSWIFTIFMVIVSFYLNVKFKNKLTNIGS